MAKKKDTPYDWDRGSYCSAVICSLGSGGEWRRIIDTYELFRHWWKEKNTLRLDFMLKFWIRTATTGSEVIMKHHFLWWCLVMFELQANVFFKWNESYWESLKNLIIHRMKIARTTRWDKTSDDFLTKQSDELSNLMFSWVSKFWGKLNSKTRSIRKIQYQRKWLFMKLFEAEKIGSERFKWWWMELLMRHIQRKHFN